ncbi:hypothetical protein DTO006G1_5460 [Penicillium roqueforti]|nr:hypothetical protein CBS147337_8613 [Penicillium roqueforti]KAI2683974.1 hypothetical protein LCP963914a_5804 [Penicillium roqueforti]KAI2696676.1 hypothetical protein CBS147372_8326 [Penicillium roqueforti]KAI2759555.1 hypothetical protein DTO006G1_5460 [Penicillium roqueforti]KAI3131203.1 hypothetical protein CBS147326_5808 [Penicillium roqueforti]
MASSLPKTYRAIQCAAPQSTWDVITLELRDPAPTEVLVRVHASGICNSDHFVKDGAWPGLQYPRIPGHEIIGRIAGVGSELLQSPVNKERFAIGALVGVGWNGGYCNQCDYCRKGQFWTCRNVDYTGFTIDGGHGEYMYAPYTAIIDIAEDVLKTASYAELAPLCCAGATVFDAINTSKWSPGDICLVQGVGGLGHLAIQYANRLGLKVYAVSSGSSKRDLALSLGACEYIDSSKIDIVEYMSSLGGANLILCTAPYSKAINAIIPAVTKNGTITLVSAATDGPIQVDNLLLNMNRATLRGFACGCAPDMEKCIEYSATNNVKAMIKVFTMDEFTQAYNGVMDSTAKFRHVIVFP